MLLTITRISLFLSVLLLGCPLAGQGLVADDNVPGTLIAEGYNIELGVGALTFPSNITHDGVDRIWITEAGIPGVPPSVRSIILADSTTAGTSTIVLTPEMLPTGRLIPPFTDLTYHDGMIWLAHRQKGANDWNVGAYSRFDPANPAGTFQTIVTNLPSVGDHSNNTLVFGEDGRAYFGQGSATNSGVVGADNADWLAMAPGFAEIAPVDLVFADTTFSPLAATDADPDANAVTAAYRPFDSGDPMSTYSVLAATPASPSNGIIAGSGTVYSFDPAADDPTATMRLEAWGLRNPFGLTFDAADPSRLFISNNGSDIRGFAGDTSAPLNPETYVIDGNRPIAGDWDELFVITTGGDTEFFGWPDFLHDTLTNEPLSITDPQFCDSPVLGTEDCPQPIFEKAFRDSLTVQPAFAPVGPFVSVTGLEPSTSSNFGFENDLFVTESGSFSPQTGAFSFTGYKIGRYNSTTGAKEDFLVNDGSTAVELFDSAGFNKPVSVAFLGDMMLVVDLGVLEPGINVFMPGTGKVWMVRKTNTTSIDLARDFGVDFAGVFPNPVRDQANLNLNLSQPLDARISVFDMQGRELSTVFDGRLSAGAQAQAINTTDLPTGTYVVRMASNGGVISRRFVVAR